MHFRLNLICLMLMACRPQSEVSHLKHDAAQYVLSPESWHWQDLTPQEFEDVYLPSNGWGSVDDFLPASHAATQRMDYLLTAIHDRIKEHHPDQLLNVPAPRSRIYRGESPDAFVTTVPVCYAVPVRLKNNLAAQNSESDMDWITLDHNGNLSGASHDGICLQRSMSQDEARDYFDWISRNIRRSASQQGQSDNLCQLDVQASYDGFEVVPNPSCQRAPELADITQAKGFVIWKTQPYIVLYTGLLQHVDAEIKIITTLAHELAHYYRSHLTSFAGDYDYFYYHSSRKNSLNILTINR